MREDFGRYYAANKAKPESNRHNNSRIHPKGKRNLMCYGKCRYEKQSGNCGVYVKPNDAYCKQTYKTCPVCKKNLLVEPKEIKEDECLECLESREE
jgi:hypothetical protein